MPPLETRIAPPLPQHGPERAAHADRLSPASDATTEGRHKLAKDPQVKATIVTSAMSFITANLGEPALKAILASFDSSEISGKRLLPSDWLLETTYRNLLVATTRYLESTSSPKETQGVLLRDGQICRQ